MFDLPGVFGTLANLAVIVIGFGAIIFIHELGHFLAAKWARIRVLAFSMGMGPVLLSYRKGMGWRRGSTEPEYRQLEADARDVAGERRERARQRLSGEVSPTEYRFSALPIGGYVKMLGQEDANPGAISDAPDSYQNCPVWKRMIVISAGVVMNLVTAAALFVIVFMVGLTVQPPVVGRVAEGSPAAKAVALNHDIEPGLKPEDVILTVDGREMRAFNEVATEVAMSGRHHPVRLLVQRPGVAAPIEFEARAVEDAASGLLDLGIAPAMSTTLAAWEEADLWARYAQVVGLEGVSPGDRLARVGGRAVERPSELIEAARASGGAPFEAEFVSPDDGVRTVSVTPWREMQSGTAIVAGGPTPVEHLLGLRPLLRVDPAADPEATKQGLRPGDVLVRIGDTEAPAIDEAMALIRANRGRDLQIEVIRAGDDGPRRVTLDVTVDRQGRIGFLPGSTADASAIVAAPVRIAPAGQAGAEAEGGETGDADASEPEPVRTPAADLIERPGTRIVSVDGRAVESLRGLAGAIGDATDAAFGAGAESFTLSVVLEPPLPVQPDGTVPTITRDWTLTWDEVASVRDLGWTVPEGELALMLFEMEETVDKAAGPLAAVGRGISKSRQVMNQTYLTFLRLFQGTVKVSHLKGPVGIAHLGTQVADQGFIWVLFFLGLVSVNLAVINFLPLPIVDGGQFLMLAYEGLRRKPVPIVFQNVATLAGLALIGAVFLIVTFHDIRALFGV